MGAGDLEIRLERAPARDEWLALEAFLPGVTVLWPVLGAFSGRWSWVGGALWDRRAPKSAWPSEVW